MGQLNNLETWSVLVSVAESGSLSATAEQMEVEVSTVSRAVASLEKALGRELLNRSTRPITLTEEGRTVVAGIRPILRAHRAFLDRIVSESGSMSGIIRLSVAGGLLAGRILPILQRFKTFYPEIDFDVSAGRMVTECLSGKIDVASVSGEVTEAGLVCLPRGRSVFVPVASPAYIAKHGAPQSPEDLIHHTGFVYSGPVRPVTTELVLGSEARGFVWKDRTLCSDILMVKKAVADGLGIAVDMPLMHCLGELEDGTFVPVLGGWHRPPIPAFGVCSEASWHVRRVRVFLDWWCKEFQREFAEMEAEARKALGSAVERCFEAFEPAEENEN